MTERMSADDFFTGLISALRLRGFSNISIRDNSFDNAVALAFEELMSAADKNEVDVRFRIKPHPIHGDSDMLRTAISHAAQRNLISVENPEFLTIRVKFSERDAEALFDALPSNPQLYLHLADEFVKNYRFVS